MNRKTLASFALVLLSIPNSTKAQAGWILDENGCKHWNPYPVPNERITWTGKCVDGLASGPGEQKWIHPTGVVSTFVGSKIQGKLSGPGVAVATDGARYEGTYLEGQPHGVGMRLWNDGTRYEGEFTGGAMTGKGVMQFPSGSRYEGQFLNGLLVGKFEGLWPSGLNPRWLENQLAQQRADTFPADKGRVRPIAKLTKVCTPTYPESARRVEATGSTRAALLVGQDGKVTRVYVTTSAGDTLAHKLLDFTAVAALWECRFEPGTINGRPSEMWASMEFKWVLD